MESNTSSPVLEFWRRAFVDGTREARWLARASELNRHATALGRMPGTRDAGVSQRLLSWVKNQRRADLHVAQVAALNAISGWTWSPHDDAWDRRADAVGQFLERERRSPRVRAADDDERSLGTWVARQRRAADRGEMPYARLLRWRNLVER